MDEHLRRPDATLAYSSIGPAEGAHTLVAAHSLATSRAWEDESALIDWDAITAAGSRVTRFDTRGHGASTAAATAPGDYSWPSLAADLVAVADAASPSRAVDGFGQSTGCGVLLWAAVTRPERFRRLVLVIPPTHGAAREAQAQLYLAAASMIELRGIEAWGRVVSVAPPPSILTAGGWVRPERVDIEEDLAPLILRGAAESVFPDEVLLRAIEQPTLILAWSEDPSHPLDAARYLAERIPGSLLEIADEPAAVRKWGTRIGGFLNDVTP